MEQINALNSLIGNLHIFSRVVTPIIINVKQKMRFTESTYDFLLG